MTIPPLGPHGRNQICKKRPNFQTKFLIIKCELHLQLMHLSTWYFQERLNSWITIHFTKDIISTQITSFTESCIFNNIIKYQFFINLVKFTVLRGNFVDNENKCYWYMNTVLRNIWSMVHILKLYLIWKLFKYKRHSKHGNFLIHAFNIFLK